MVPLYVYNSQLRHYAHHNNKKLQQENSRDRDYKVIVRKSISSLAARSALIYEYTARIPLYRIHSILARTVASRPAFSKLATGLPPVPFE